MELDTAALLPLCVALSLVGLVVTIVFWRSRRASRGRILQGLAWTLVPIALYLTGLLRLVFDAVVALVGWVSQIAFSPVVWTGFALLGVAVVLLVVGSLMVRRSHLRADPSGKGGRARPAVRGGAAGGAAVGTGAGASATGAGRAGKKAPAGTASAAPAQDDDMAEIEALLKSRGIQ